MKEAWAKEGGVCTAEWVGLTCDDPDDFQSLKDRVWATGTDFKSQEHVVLWRKDASAPPAGQDGYVRSLTVVKVVSVTVVMVIVLVVLA